ncbi:hypothetical protein ACHQM5_008234 [Ranunculus cassubicifolius]
MAAIATTSTTSFPFLISKPHHRNHSTNPHTISSHHHFFKLQPLSTIKPYNPLNPTSKTLKCSTLNSSPPNNSLIDNDDKTKEIIHQLFDENENPLEKPIKFVLWVLVWASVSLAVTAFVGDNNANAAVAESIRDLGFGVKFANALRGFGWPDEAVVVALATLPVVELRGAIPVGYWLQLKPWVLTVLAVIGNMLPVPLIILYLKRFASFLAQNSPSASRFLDLLFERAKKKAGPIQEFQWLGLMLFVAVPFPGTGAWTGAIIASILDMPFWPAVSANFFGVVLAGLLVNLLVNMGLKYAIVTGVGLFLVSTFMWSALRNFKRSLSTSN